MKNIQTYKTGILFSFFMVLLVSSCEIKEPWIEPTAGFQIQYLDKDANEIVILTEPYTLTAGVRYDFVLTGEGMQNAYWWGVLPTDKKRGSDYNDRGKNQNSRGSVDTKGVYTTSYADEGTYTLVQVVSSYTYADDKYAEAILSKEITVVPDLTPAE